ncbi:HlyD family secretion protein [Chamaesiphon polymorphus CCALA 037]|uniref:HlyD family secretion protein n=2 Tax=Chamaesiphon TaxID=217161 RepID=A0A2T1GKW1_9CYAN|nr:HlyD family secretion protein [Chamaesiphon polymorphus CCALA 037]
MVLSNHDSPDYIRKALAAGARGYLLKNTPAQELIHAIHLIYRGYLQIGPGLFEKLESSTLESIDRNNSLTVDNNHLIDANTLLEPVTADGSIVPVQTGMPTVVANDGWSSAVQEQLEALPQVWTRGLLYFLGIFALIALPWVLFSKVDETSTARGRLEPKGATIRLDAKSNGTVIAVRVKEGQFVRAGQVLLELESNILRTEFQQIQAKLGGQIERLTQSELIKNQVMSSLSVQKQQNQAQRLEKQAQVAQVRQTLSSTQLSAPLQIAEKLTEVEKAAANLNAARRTLQVVKQGHQNNLAEVERYRKLWQQGAIAEVKVVEVQKQANVSSSSLVQSEGAVQDAEKLLQGQQKTYQKLQQQLQAEQTQLQLRLKEQISNQQSIEQGGTLTLSKSQQQLDDLQVQISTLKSEITQTQKQIQSLTLQLEQRIVRSPANGVIFQLPIKKAQTFVQPGQVVAQIAPQGLPLILKAQASSQQSGQMRVGMPVKLKFDAYPFQDYGVISGKLRWISPDSKTIDVGQGQAEIFELEITLDKNHIENADRRIQLTPGQSATAETIIRQRRIIDFILDPFRQLQKGGLKL